MRTLTKSFLVLLIAAPLAFLACAQVKEQARRGIVPTSQSQSGDSIPAGSDPLLAIHDPKPASCVGCHESKRPDANHFAGQDCVSCHNYPSFANLGSDTLQVIHNPKPASCVGCHEDKRPAANHYAGKDCASCHSFPDFKNAFFAHAPKPETCEDCHARPTTVGLRAYPNIGTPANFNPNNPAEPGSGHYRGKDCVTCHASPAENATQFTFTHTKQSPQACLPCHFQDGTGEHLGDNRGVVLTGFGNCFTCHDNFDSSVGRDWGRN